MAVRAAVKSSSVTVRAVAPVIAVIAVILHSVFHCDAASASEIPSREQISGNQWWSCGQNSRPALPRRRSVSLSSCASTVI